MSGMTTIDPSELRRAFGTSITRVTVMTERAPNGTPVGFTAKAFSFVSLDLVLLRVCPGKFQSFYDISPSAKHFAVRMLAEGQEDVFNALASDKGDRLSCIANDIAMNGVSLIWGALAWFSCTFWHAVSIGDHCVFLGRGVAFDHMGGAGLGYGGGRFFRLWPARTPHILSERTL
jgi:flavin reductase (DIM6/NTAB) family NADH-FMN oxidoreductase RutF